MEFVNLNECCKKITDYVASGSFASLKENVKVYKHKEYAILVKTADFANNFTKDLTYTDIHGYKFLSNSNLFGGELILSNIGSIGKVFIVPNLEQPMTLASNSIMVVPNDDYLIKYLYYFFLSSYGQKQLFSISSATSMPKFNKTQLKTVLIPKNELHIQRKIINDLDNINYLIDNYKKQIANLDNIVKSQFIEMFDRDLKGNTVKLSDVTSVITKGTTPTTLGYEFVDEGINFIKIECLTDDYQFIKNKMLHITEECNEKLKRSKLQKDDVLFSIAGAIGRTAIVNEDVLPANTNQALAIIRLKEFSNLNVDFLNEMLHSTLIEEQVNNKKTGVAQINLSLTDIGNLDIIIPDIERQKEYANFVKQIDKSKYFGGVCYGIC